MEMVILPALVCLFSLLGLASANRPVLTKNSLMWSDTFEACRNKTFKSLSELNLREPQIKTEVLSAMELNSTAWISSVANFSEFTAYLGCWSMNSVNLSRIWNQLIYNGVFQCSNYCNGPRYIGMMNDTCYCNVDPPGGESNSNCTTVCQSYSGELCGGPNAISVYQIVNQTQIGKKKKLFEHGQCVLVTNTSDGLQWTTHSCSSCHECGFNCETCSPTKYCYTPGNESLTRDTAALKCKRHFNPAGTDFSHLDLAEGQEYWTSLFRTFDVYQKSSVNSNDSCIYVYKKDNHTLILEAAYCSEKKQFLCLDTNSSSSAKPPTSTARSTSTTLARKLDEMSKAGEEGGNFPILEVVAPPVALIIFCTVIVIIVLCKKKLLRKTNKAEAQKVGYEEATGQSEPGRDCQRDSAAGNNSSVTGAAPQYDCIPAPALDDQYAEIVDISASSKSPNSKPSPRKPERKSLKAKQGLLMHEGLLTRPSTDESLDDTYNILNDFSQSSAEGEILNVYDHAIHVNHPSTATAQIAETDNVYDHTETPQKAAKAYSDDLNLYSRAEDNVGSSQEGDIYNQTNTKDCQQHLDSNYQHLDLKTVQ